MTDAGAWSFGERVVSLIDAGRTSATYKLATLLALLDVAAEATSPVDGAPTTLSGRRVGQRVVELYWPQTSVYGLDASGAPAVLRQSPQNDIPAKLARWRRDHDLLPGASLDDARRVDPKGWERLERELVTTVLRMPLPKLQRFGSGRLIHEDRFIYDFGWPDESPASVLNRPGFDDSLVLQAGVGEWLVKLTPLIRPFAQLRWSSLIARQNPDLVDDRRLDEFLFGASRISLDRVREALRDQQAGRCFYCAQLTRRPDVDHFLPWSRHPDNTVDNLVAACSRCNNAKSASIAAPHHLQAWLSRRSDSAELDAIAAATGFARRPDRTLGTVTATYLWLPHRTPLWLRDDDYELVDRARLRQLLTM
jgi:5-methylcytosine-specific restriction endonuclease McrA